MEANGLAETRLRKDAELNRQRIVAAAREVFRDRGLSATLNDVARHAGVGVGTVYRRFADKNQLIDALLDHMIATVETATREALLEPDAWVGLTQALEKVCEQHALDRGLRELMLGTGTGPQRQAQMRERFAPLVGQLVARAKAQGRLRSDILPPDLPLIQLMLGAVTEPLRRDGAMAPLPRPDHRRPVRPARPPAPTRTAHVTGQTRAPSRLRPPRERAPLHQPAPPSQLACARRTTKGDQWPPWPSDRRSS